MYNISYLCRTRDSRHSIGVFRDYVRSAIRIVLQAQLSFIFHKSEYRPKVMDLLNFFFNPQISLYSHFYANKIDALNLPERACIKLFEDHT